MTMCSSSLYSLYIKYLFKIFSFYNNMILVSGGSSIGSLPSFSKNSSLLFTTSSSGEKQRKSYKMGPGFGSHKLKLEPEVSDEGWYRKKKIKCF